MRLTCGVAFAFFIPCCLLLADGMVAAFSQTLSPIVATTAIRRGGTKNELLLQQQQQQPRNTAECGRLVGRRRVTLRESSNDNVEPDYESEETLLKMHLDAKQADMSAEQVKEIVIKYCQSFPFAAVLPVQPLQYLPAFDKDGNPDGVELKFLRKKTDDKSGVDGGIRFFVEQQDNNGLDVTAKRNSRGQSIQKIYAEKLVVTAFVSGITGEETEKYGKAPLDVIQVTSFVHNWM